MTEREYRDNSEISGLEIENIEINGLEIEGPRINQTQDIEFSEKAEERAAAEERKSAEAAQAFEFEQAEQLSQTGEEGGIPEEVLMDEIRPESSKVEYRFAEEAKKGPGPMKVVLGLIMVLVLGFSIGFGYRFASHFYSEKIIEVKTAHAAEGSNVSLDVDGTSTLITQIAEKYSPAIVSVIGEQRGYYGNTRSVVGTGVVFSQDKDRLYILSNEHVIKYGSGFSYEDNPVYISLGGDRLYKTKILGSDSLADLAVVSIEKKDIPKDFLDKLIPVTFADSTKVKVGEWVVAMGNPLGYIDTTTFGIVSGRDRKVGKSGLDVELIQLDAAINSGNSGGATFNIKGEVIGINTIKIKETGVEGLAFAIASNDVKNVISQIMEKGRVERVFLGIQGRSIEDMASSQFEAPEDETKGVFIENTFRDTGASEAGLRQGDIIHKVDDVEIETMQQLSALIKSKKVGDKVVLTIRRGDEMDKKVEVVLGARPDLE